MYDIPYILNLKRKYTNELKKQKETDLEDKLKVFFGEGIVRDFGKVLYALQYLKWITNKDLLYSTRNSVQCYMLAWLEGGFRGEWIHVHAMLSPFAVQLKLPQHY